MLTYAFEGNYDLTQGFGEHPEWYGRFGLPGHNGVDFALPQGTPVLAPEDGTCIEDAYDPQGYGNYVKLRTVDGPSIATASRQPARV